MGDVLHTADFTLDVSDGWRVQEDGRLYALLPPDGGTALDISCSKANTPLTEADLRYLNRETIEEGHIPEQVQLGDFRGLAFSYVEDEIHWFHWDLVRDCLWLQIGYDCKASDRDTKIAAVNRMLASLKVKDNAI